MNLNLTTYDKEFEKVVFLGSGDLKNKFLGVVPCLNFVMRPTIIAQFPTKICSKDNYT